MLSPAHARPLPAQNKGLDEHRVRDLNDAINKLHREKGHWERQIKALGGPDYFRTAPKAFGDEAQEVVPGVGYRYYGAAKDLPGVRELFKKPPPERTKRTRFEMLKGIDADYYGYRDDDDGVLAKVEDEAEPERMLRLMEEWQTERTKRHAADPDGVLAREEEGDDAPEERDHFVAHVEARTATAPASAPHSTHRPRPSNR